MKIASLLLLGAVCYVYGQRFGPGSDDNPRSITGAIEGIKNFFKSEVTTLKPYKPYPMQKPYKPYKPYYPYKPPTIKKPVLAKPLKIPIPIPFPVSGKTGPIKLLVQVANIQDDTSTNGSNGFLGNALRNPKSLVRRSSKSENHTAETEGHDGSARQNQQAPSDKGATNAGQHATNNSNHNVNNHDHANGDHLNNNTDTKNDPDSSPLDAGIDSLLPRTNQTRFDRSIVQDSRSSVTRIGNTITSPSQHDPSGILPGTKPDILDIGAALLGPSPLGGVNSGIGNAVIGSPAISGLPTPGLSVSSGLGGALLPSLASSVLGSLNPDSRDANREGNTLVASTSFSDHDASVDADLEVKTRSG